MNMADTYSYDNMCNFGKYLMENQNIVEMFKIKAHFMSAVREYLNKVGAIELQMPNLQKYREGAPVHQFIIEHPITKERFYLRHCMEDHLRRVSNAFGMVYELGKAFRVETEDQHRAIEFLVLEFVGKDILYREGIQLICKLIQYAVKKTFGDLKVNGIDFTTLTERPFDIIMNECLSFNSTDPECLSKSKAVLMAKGIVVPTEEWAIYEELLKHFIEPSISSPTVMTDLPKCLQHVCALDMEKGFAKRFSIIVNGVEICDGGEKFSSSQGYREVYSENASYRQDNFGIIDNDDPIEFYTDIDSSPGPVFTFGLGIDRSFAVLNGKDIRDVILFPYR